MSSVQDIISNVMKNTTILIENNGDHAKDVEEHIRYSDNNLPFESRKTRARKRKQEDCVFVKTTDKVYNLRSKT